MSERWKRIERLYHAALERDTATREAFLAEACADDEELRREVVSLIAYDGHHASLIESPALEVAAREWADESSSLLSRPSASAPPQIGAYKILSPLGRGGMGEVWLAYDTRLGRKVAIKLLPTEFTSRPERVRRFEQEARAASALNHPNIVTIYEIGEIDGRRFIVTEYVEGETLRRRTAKAPQQRVRLSEALEVASQVAAALQAAHEAGITHRDIKPENVMARKDGLVKVLDFGLAKPTKDGQGDKETRRQGDKEPQNSSFSPFPHLPFRSSPFPPLTTPGMVLGTTSYMSPEQARGETVDHRTDIFSLGVMLYEMLAGRRPFEGATASDVMAAILIGEPTSLMEIDPQTPAHLWRIVRRCLEKEPERRFQSAGDLAFALAEFNAPSAATQGSEAAGVTRTQMRAAAPAPRHPGKRPGRWIIATLAAPLMLAAIVLAVFHLRERPEENLAVSFSFGLPDNWEFRWFDSPAVSPDGKYIVYSAVPVSAQGRNEVSLWLRRLDSAEAKPLPGAQGGFSPFWAPDSRSVAFWAKGRLRKIDVSGGSAVTICEAGDSLPGSWNQEGVILFSANTNLSRVAAAGGQAVALKFFADGETRQHSPRFLPDGKHFLYFSQNRDQQNDGIYVSSLDPGAQRKLILKGAVFAAYVPTGHLLFTRENLLMAQRFDLRRLEVMGEPVRVAEQVASYTGDSSIPFAAFSASENGVLAWKVKATDPDKTQLTWFDRSGKRLGTLGESAMYSGPSFSPGEDRLVVSIANPGNRMRDLWIMQLPLGDNSRLTFDPGDDLNPRWTPDGKWIIFTSTQNGRRNIYRKLADGAGEAQRLLESEESLNVEDISPDGRFLIFNYYPAQKEPHLALLSLRGERKRIPFPTTQFREESGRFSPNGRWIAYRSMEKGESKIFVRAFPLVGGDAGSKWQISDRTGNQPQWRGDGKELFFLEYNTLMAVEVNTEGASFSAGTPKPLFSANIEAEQRRNRYIATKDGQRFLVVMRAPTAIETMIAVQVNWPAALKQ
ncbi:MAG TPA: protein kinase [Blastocatellia bacterium]|jgi:serine/threonine protein kinase/Tol biopolymer transport system component